MRKSTMIFQWVQDFLEPVIFNMGGSRAKGPNELLIKQSLLSWASIPMELEGDSCTSSQLRTNLSLCYKAVCKMDFLDTLEVLERCYRYLIKERTSMPEFKAQTTRSERHIIAPIMPAVKAWYDREDYDALKLSLTFFRFLQKLPFDVPALEKAALADFLATEERLSCLNLSENPFVDQLQKILLMWLRDCKVSDLPVRHGSGSVAEGSLTKAEKYLALGSDRLLDLQFQFAFKSDGANYYPFGFRSKIERFSRVRFVPKTATKLRTICMEPVTLQYFQQGIMRIMYRYIANHDFLSRHIVLADQTLNQRLACMGSSNGLFCTIDLSAASDSVSWALVKQLFKGTNYGTWATATRSSGHILPDKSRIKSFKFAPMGSALCFPTECLVFCAVVELVARRREYSLYDENSYSLYSVYGDDIVCPAGWAEEIIEILSSLGFLVNNDKSYFTGPFRESCGKEYYNGHDVTPLYYRMDPRSATITPTDFASLCSGANTAFDHGLFRLREHYIDLVLRSKRSRLPRWMKSVPLFTNQLGHSPAIYSPMCSNFQLQSNWNTALQRTEWQHLTVSSREEGTVEPIVTDTIDYFEFLVERRFNPEPLLDEPSFRSIVPRRPAWSQVYTADYML